MDKISIPVPVDRDLWLLHWSYPVFGLCLTEAGGPLGDSLPPAGKACSYSCPTPHTPAYNLPNLFMPQNWNLTTFLCGGRNPRYATGNSTLPRTSPSLAGFLTSSPIHTNPVDWLILLLSGKWRLHQTKTSKSYTDDQPTFRTADESHVPVMTSISQFQKNKHYFPEPAHAALCTSSTHCPLLCLARSSYLSFIGYLLVKCRKH